MQDQPNDFETRVGRPDPEVEYLNSQISSLKLELATLISAVQELQVQQPVRPLPVRAIPIPIAPRKPSAVPAGVVVLLFAGLLSWQVLIGPRGEVTQAPIEPVATRVPAPEPAIEPAPAIAAPVITPTVYRGTLSVDADQPAAEVFVNRQRVGTAPVRVRNLRAGSHLVWIESEGHRRWTRVITVPAQRVTRVSADLEPVEPIEDND